jgi:hypothetical protein
MLMSELSTRKMIHPLRGTLNGHPVLTMCRTKLKRNDAKKRKDEEIRKESNEEDPLLPRGDKNTNLPINTEDPHLLSGSIGTHMSVNAEEQEDYLLNGVDERGVDNDKEPRPRGVELSKI